MKTRFVSTGAVAPLMLHVGFACLASLAAHGVMPAECVSAERIPSNLVNVRLTDSRGAPGTTTPAPAEAAAEAFFSSTNLSTFQVQLGTLEFQRLSHAPREYVPGRVLIDGKLFENVGVRLKGTGTFQPLSRRPNLALKFNWRVPGREFAGLTKLLLNNSRQDPTLLCDLIASAAFADAGVPAPRITHARVELNGRDLGRYVVAEAVNQRFLKRHFQEANGNLYEGAFQDIRARLKQENGVPGNRSDLKQLCDAALLEDLGQRRRALGKVLEVEEFLNFLAVEMIVASWDGYAIHQNNYRIYHNPRSGRMAFVPHGLDNTLFESGLPLMPPRKSILVSALLQSPEDRDAFRVRVAALLPKVLDPTTIRTRVRAGVARLSQGASPEEEAAIERRASLVEQHVRERNDHLRAQLAGVTPPTPSFDSNGVAQLQGWRPKPDWNDSLVQEVRTKGKSAFMITATNEFCFGSWRLPVWLAPGTYRLEGLAMTEGVMGLPSMTGSGAGVRIPQGLRGSGLQRSHAWAPVHHEFAVQEGCEWVELVAELRAYHGRAFFDRESLRLVRSLPGK